MFFAGLLSQVVKLRKNLCVERCDADEYGDGEQLDDAK